MIKQKHPGYGCRYVKELARRNVPADVTGHRPPVKAFDSRRICYDRFLCVIIRGLCRTAVQI